MKIQYIILIILIIISMLNFYYFTYGRKIKNNNNKHFEKLKALLENKEKLYIKENHIKPIYKNLIVVDNNSGFIILVDEEKSKIIFIEEDNITSINIKSIENIENKIIKNGKFLIEAKLIINTSNNIFTYYFGTKKRKLKSVLSNFIIDNCNSTYSEIEQLLEK